MVIVIPLNKSPFCRQFINCQIKDKYSSSAAFSGSKVSLLFTELSLVHLIVTFAPRGDARSAGLCSETLPKLDGHPDNSKNNIRFDLPGTYA